MSILKLITSVCTLILLLSLTSSAYAEFEDIRQEEKADLDSDGVTETIVMEWTLNTGEFVLRINDEEIEGWLEPDLTGFNVVDIDTSDEFFEIEIHTAGPSDDYESIFFTWRDGHIVEMAHIYGYTIIQGDGNVLANSWMGFWMRTDVYRLKNANHRLEQVEQEVYSVKLWTDAETLGVQCTVLEPFEVYTSDDMATVLDVADTGETMDIVAYHSTGSSQTDEENWGGFEADRYMVRTQSGLTGWISLDVLWDKVEGLQWAD